MKILSALEYWWRHSLVYPVLRKIFSNAEKSIPLDLRSTGSILILRYDRIGDMIVTTPIFKALKKTHPHLKIGVFASKANAEIIQNNPNIDRVHILHPRWWLLWREIKNACNENYDVVLNLVFNRTTSGGILSNLIAPNGIKIGQGAEKYRFYFNVLLELSRQSSHMIEILVSIIHRVFDIQLEVHTLHYDILLDDTTNKKVEEFQAAHNLQRRLQLEKNKIPYILFNLSANDEVRKLSQEQALRIGEHLGANPTLRTLLLHAPEDSLMLSVKCRLIQKAHCLSFPEKGNASLLEIAAIIQNASLVITPDTSIVHFASAFKTPLLGFYTSMQDVHEWLPFQVKNRIVLSEKHRPTSSIPVQQMIDAVDDFIRTIMVQKDIAE
jgi:ADP-heptose:LPS heptosyltransferase